MHEGIGRTVGAAAGWAAALALASSASAAPLSAAIAQVAAPGALCAAANDAASVLAVGQRTEALSRVALFALDASGAPKPGEPRALALAPPPALGAGVVYPLALAFHPARPLLYVWQDIHSPPNPKLALEQFDHLLVCSLKDGAAEPIAAVGRGSEFAFNQKQGALAVSPDGRRIYLSNLQSPGRDEAAIGYFDLDEAGLPARVPVPLQGTLDGFGLNRFELQYRPHTIHVNHLGGGAAVRGMIAASRDVALFAAGQGVAFWDTSNRRAGLGAFVVPGFSLYTFLGGEPDVPYVVAASPGAGMLLRIGQADGYLSQLPQRLDVPGASFQSPPVVLAGLNGVAVGGEKQVHLLPLDAEGRFAGPAETAAVPSPAVRALAFSRRHKRLYVPVEALP